MNKGIIGQIPAQGYGGNVNQSAIALCWLRTVAEELEENGMFLSSKLSIDGEQRILNKSVDGYCEENRTIYQFHGCFFHGCKNCYDDDTNNPVVNETFYTLRERTRRTTRLFEAHGYRVIEKWECDFIRENKITQSSQKTLRHRDFFINLNLNPRDALFGGRTSPAVLYHESLTEKTRYRDFTSLYPFVQHPHLYNTHRLFVG